MLASYLTNFVNIIIRFLSDHISDRIVDIEVESLADNTVLSVNYTYPEVTIPKEKLHLEPIVILKFIEKKALDFGVGNRGVRPTIHHFCKPILFPCFLDITEINSTFYLP